MLSNNLIKQCVCGNSIRFKEKTINGLPVLECNDCGVVHQHLPNFTYEDYIGFYQYQYHDLYQEKKGVISYADRYEHDCKVADLRLDAYTDLVRPGMKGLDVGSSNSAFVHRAISRGLDCVGLEPGDAIGDDAVTIRGTILTATIENDRFDFVTMHDSIEHMVDVDAEMLAINRVMKQGGLLVVDLPDYFGEAGQHHWKRVEHLWMFNKEDMEDFLWLWGFEVFNVTTPIPGKFVFYARKK